jgi:hypothetical protein
MILTTVIGGHLCGLFVSFLVVGFCPWLPIAH